MAKSVIAYHAHTPCWGDPPIFYSDHDAIQWAVGQGAFADIEGAGRAFAQLRGLDGRWARWLGVVANRLNSRTKWSF